MSHIGNINTISTAGGLTRFNVFNQVQADALNKTVKKYENSEASSLRAAMSTCVTLGIYENYQQAFYKMSNNDAVIFSPEPSHVEKYKILRERKNFLYSALSDKKVYEAFYEKM